MVIIVMFVSVACIKVMPMITHFFAIMLEFNHKAHTKSKGNALMHRV